MVPIDTQMTGTAEAGAVAVSDEALPPSQAASSSDSSRRYSLRACSTSWLKGLSSMGPTKTTLGARGRAYSSPKTLLTRMSLADSRENKGVAAIPADSCCNRSSRSVVNATA